MPTTLKGPGLFLAQFTGDAAPFDTLDGICGWAAGLGYGGVQIPTWDGRLFDPAHAAENPPVRTGPATFGDWRTDAPGVVRLIRPSDLPPP